MELMLENVSEVYQTKFNLDSTMPSAVTLAQFLGCFAVPILVKPSAVSSIRFKAVHITSYLALSVLVFGATALSTASLS